MLTVRIAEGRRVEVGGPWFEDLEVGAVFAGAPALTLGDGHAVLHQATTGDRLRLPLDQTLSRAVTGRSEPVAHPLLVTNVAIGQTTEVTQRVKANLFYRGLVLERPVHLGDTLRTTTEVVGLRQNRSRPGRAATGLVALRCTTRNQHGEVVLDFYRCPMLPLRPDAPATAHAGDFDAIPAEIDDARLLAAVPAWDLGAYRAAVPGAERAVDLLVGTVYGGAWHDTVTGACQLARATLNLAEAHTDATASPYGRRLVYGGHTIALAGAALTRALPGLVTILAWRSCDHAGPVFEGDVLRTDVEVEAVTPIGGDGAGLVDLRARVTADRTEGSGPETGAAGILPPAPAGAPAGSSLVLDWRFVGLVA